MEKFKAVEKEMKTKAYSKEGLSAAAKLDPKEKEKLETCQFLSSMVEELERQIETVEAEAESLQANLKRGKKDTAKADRVAEIERMTERHKWHQSKLELILRALENGGLETDAVLELQESIKYYVENNQEADFMDDDAIYDDLHLQEEEDVYGVSNELDRVSSQDAQSVQDDGQEGESKGPGGGKARAEGSATSARRPSTQMRSPLPALATLHTPLPTSTNGVGGGGGGGGGANMRPAPPPSRPAGETLKYASAAAAGATSDKNGVVIAPLPPPPGTAAIAASSSSFSSGPIGLSPLPPAGGGSRAASSSTSATSPQSDKAQVVVDARPSAPVASQVPASYTQEKIDERRRQPFKSVEPSKTTADVLPGAVEMQESVLQEAAGPFGPSTTTTFAGAANLPNVSPIATAAQSTATTTTPSNSSSNHHHHHHGDDRPGTSEDTEFHDESVYHLPPGLQDLVQSFEATKKRVQSSQVVSDTVVGGGRGGGTPTNTSTTGTAIPTTAQSTQRMLSLSHATIPESIDADRPRPYQPETRFSSPAYYPQEPLTVFDDPRLYSRVDTDTLFYVFYYRQNSFPQYLAAKSLKSQSWRFHKQYQTWFQRHEEPKTITEEFEQGTYRFFDYESTWFVFIFKLLYFFFFFSFFFSAFFSWYIGS